MDRIIFPSSNDLLRLNNKIPSWSISTDDFPVIENSLSKLYAGFDTSSWVRLVINRIQESDLSLIQAGFYFEKDIPDHEWASISDGTINYFPHFDDNDNMHKFMFEYFSDVFLYKAFSVLDTLAHLISPVYDIEWVKDDGNISFYKAVDKLSKNQLTLHNDLKKITNSYKFRKIGKLRNDSTHNFSSGHVSSGVIREGNKIRLTVGTYMPVKEKYLLIVWMSKKIIEILNLVKVKK